MLTDAFHDCDTKIGIRYQTNGKLFNLRRLQAKTNVEEVTVCELLFADDCFLNAKSESDLQWSMDYFSSACDKFGLTIIRKPEVMYWPAPGKPYVEPTIKVTGQTLQVNLSTVYLSSTRSCAVHNNDALAILALVSSVAFGRLCAIVWERRGNSQQTNLKVYKDLALPTLM